MNKVERLDVNVRIINMRFRALGQRWIVAALALSFTPPTVAQFPGPTAVNGNGFRGPMTITAPGNEEISGTFYTGRPFASPLTGHYGSGSRWFVALRGDPANPSQAWIGRYNSSQSFVEGEIHTLRTVEGGGSPWRNVFAFRGNRPGPVAPTSPGSLPRRLSPSVYNMHPSNISGIYQMTANSVPGDLRIIQQDANGHIAGTIYGTNRIAGHYAWQTGTVVFIRYLNDQPIQVFRGTAENAVAPVLIGAMFPLNPNGGSSGNRSAFDWRTTSVVPIQPRSGLLRQLPNLPNSAIGVVSNFNPANATHATPQVIETHCPLNQGLTFFPQRAVVSSRLNVAPGAVATVASPNHRQEIFWLCGHPGSPVQASDLKRTICDSPGANVITISRSGTGSRIRTRCYWSPDVPF